MVSSSSGDRAAKKKPWISSHWLATSKSHLTSVSTLGDDPQFQLVGHGNHRPGDRASSGSAVMSWTKERSTFHGIEGNCLR